jgi:nucleotide-binding universal stress UspA family protein
MAATETRATILMATDFSETAAAALDWAVEIARGRGARILLLHALRPSTPLPGFLAPGVELYDRLQDAANARLEETAAALSERGVEVAPRLGAGLPSDVIAETAVQVGADLAVVGTRGLTGFRHLLLGSTAQEVINQARCPVLTIHPGDAGRHRPLRTILVPTDFSEDADLAVRTAHRLLAPLEGETRLVLLHAYHIPVEYTAYGPIPTGLDFPGGDAGETERRLAEAADALRGEGLAVETASREGYAPEVIAEEARERGADLVAMCTHGRSGLRHLLLGSTAERVVQLAPCPVLTVRATSPTPS